jgi:hypothetical protein
MTQRWTPLRPWMAEAFEKARTAGFFFLGALWVQ